MNKRSQTNAPAVARKSGAHRRERILAPPKEFAARVFAGARVTPSPARRDQQAMLYPLFRQQGGALSARSCRRKMGERPSWAEVLVRRIR